MWIPLNPRKRDQSHSYRGIEDLSDQELANAINEAFLEPLEEYRLDDNPDGIRWINC